MIGIQAFFSAAAVMSVILFTIAALFGTLSFQKRRGFFSAVMHTRRDTPISEAKRIP